MGGAIARDEGAARTLLGRAAAKGEPSAEAMLACVGHRDYSAP